MVCLGGSEAIAPAASIVHDLARSVGIWDGPLRGQGLRSPQPIQDKRLPHTHAGWRTSSEDRIASWWWVLALFPGHSQILDLQSDFLHWLHSNL